MSVIEKKFVVESHLGPTGAINNAPFRIHDDVDGLTVLSVSAEPVVGRDNEYELTFQLGNEAEEQSLSVLLSGGFITCESGENPRVVIRCPDLEHAQQLHRRLLEATNG